MEGVAEVELTRSKRIRKKSSRLISLEEESATKADLTTEFQNSRLTANNRRKVSKISDKPKSAQTTPPSPSMSDEREGLLLPPKLTITLGKKPSIKRKSGDSHARMSEAGDGVSETPRTAAKAKKSSRKKTKMSPAEEEESTEDIPEFGEPRDAGRAASLDAVGHDEEELDDKQLINTIEQSRTDEVFQPVRSSPNNTAKKPQKTSTPSPKKGSAAAKKSSKASPVVRIKEEMPDHVEPLKISLKRAGETAGKGPAFGGSKGKGPAPKKKKTFTSYEEEEEEEKPDIGSLPGFDGLLSGESSSEEAGTYEVEEDESLKAYTSGAQFGGDAQASNSPDQLQQQQTQAQLARNFFKRHNGGAVLKIAEKPRKRTRNRKPTAYTMWCNHMRINLLNQNPNLDFVGTSKRLAEMWNALPMKDKKLWQGKAKRLANQGVTSKMLSAQYKAAKKGDPDPFAKTPRGRSSGKGKELASATPVRLGGKPATVANLTRPSTVVAKARPAEKPYVYKVTGSEPLDVAAHLKLLGETLTTIGIQLTNGNKPMDNVMDTIMDTFFYGLCAVTALTQQIPGIDGPDAAVCNDTFDNIAHLLPDIDKS